MFSDSPSGGTTVPAKEQDAAGASCTFFRMIATGLIASNSFNANEMTPQEFAALCKEVRRLGRLPKPVVVRKIGDNYEVVDGEYGLRAARDAHIAEVACEVIEADDVEAVRQNYKRNEHGTRNALKQGRAFAWLKSASNLSNRKLAAALGIPEATIRTYLDYAKAFEVRNSCAPQTAETDIARLSVRQVQRYLELPDGGRDAWLDGGADVAVETTEPEQAAHQTPGKADDQHNATRKPATAVTKEDDGHDENAHPEPEQAQEDAGEALAEETHGQVAAVTDTAPVSFDGVLQGVRTAASILQRNEELCAKLAACLSAEEKAQMLEELENVAGAVGRLQSLLGAGETAAVKLEA